MLRVFGHNIPELVFSFAVTALIAGCLGESATEVEPPETTVLGSYLLVSVAGNDLPAPLAFCNPTCSGTRLVVTDTLEIEDVSVPRFRWSVVFAEDAISPVQRVEVTGRLVGALSGFYLESDNHPVVPQTTYIGLFFIAQNGRYELEAYPPWKSSGFARFSHVRVSR